MISLKFTQKYLIVFLFISPALWAIQARASEKPPIKDSNKKPTTTTKTILDIAAHKPIKRALIDTGNIKHPTILKPTTINITLQQNSLSHAVAQLASLSGWHQVIWNASQDYNLYGQVHIKANNIANAMVYLLSDYPLQATFYDRNHIVAISNRSG